ncbi:MAG: Rieske 2Fe-2S domain-containing protein [Meiothermus silvanus]|nr:Rieske 2Fe-2S domain-containing protein [Allomeiothermus silvanus]
MSKNTIKRGRRALLKKAVQVGAALVAAEVLAQSNGVKAGDILVYAEGSDAGKPVVPANLPFNKAVTAYAMDPQSKVIKNDSKGLIVLVRLDRKSLDAETAKNAADGIVAYSAICTHQGCPVREIGSLGSGRGNLICTCHGSIYNPRAQARVLGGPAPRPLPALPVKIQNGMIVAKGVFTGKIGL